MKRLLTGIAVALALAAPAHGGRMPEAHYTIESVHLPKHVAPEIGGLAFTGAGELVVVTRRSGVFIGTVSDDPARFGWRQFASPSLHNPMGVLVEADNQLLIPTMQELTRITDTDGDGEADRFMAVARDAWGLSGNYHETVAGPLPTGDGGWFVAPGTASHNGPTFDLTKGEYSKIGRRGRNYSSVKYAGWILKITEDGDVIPWASGFRMHNGIGMSPDGRVWATDNQGDWKPTTPVYLVEKGNFYGHPSSLVWDPEFMAEHDDPLAWGVENLEAIDAMRTKPAVQLPHGIVCNSATEPVFDTTDGAFGPFAGQMLIGDVAGQRILRVMLEEVDGTMQGAVAKFIEGSGLRAGNNRMTFSPDGKTLYVGQTVRGWGKPSEGLQRITFQGKAPMDVLTTSLTRDGFELRFTRRANPDTIAMLANYAVSKYYYEYTQAYGSSRKEVTTVAVSDVEVLGDGMGVRLRLDSKIETDRIYQLELRNIQADDGDALVNPAVYYTVNRLRP